jgi:hypothetical protein
MYALLRSLPFAALLAAADGDLLDRSACTFPPYQKTARMERFASQSEYEGRHGR